MVGANRPHLKEEKREFEWRKRWRGRKFQLQSKNYELLWSWGLEVRPFSWLQKSTSRVISADYYSDSADMFCEDSNFVASQCKHTKVWYLFGTSNGNGSRGSWKFVSRTHRGGGGNYNGVPLPGGGGLTEWTFCWGCCELKMNKHNCSFSWPVSLCVNVSSLGSKNLFPKPLKSGPLSFNLDNISLTVEVIFHWWCCKIALPLQRLTWM